MKTYLCIVLTAFMIAIWGNLGIQESKKYYFIIKKEKVSFGRGFCVGWKKSFDAHAKPLFQGGWNQANNQWKSYIKKVGEKQTYQNLLASSFSSGVTHMPIKF